MKRPLYEVIYSGYGCGKSTYAIRNLENLADTFKLGIGNFLSETILLNFGAIKKHEQENKLNSLKFKGTTLKNITYNIREINNSILLIDDWASLSIYTLLNKEKTIDGKIDEIFSELSLNNKIEKCIFVCTASGGYLPFKLYKKVSLWNKRLFKEADKITKVEYGIPVKIK